MWALSTSLFGIFTGNYWKDMWVDMKRTFSPLSSCGIRVDTYSCGLFCNQDADDDEVLPVTSKGNNAVAQSSTTMPEKADLQRPFPTVVVEEMV